MIKKLLLILISIVVVISLMSACGAPAKDEVVVDIDALAKEIESAGLFIDTLELITKESVLGSVLFLSTGKIEYSALYMGSGATAEEFAVFKCVSEEAAADIVSELNVRIQEQKARYADYAPDAVPRLNNAVIAQKGSYVLYIVSDNYQQARKLAEESFG